MKIPRWVTGSIIAIALGSVIIGALGFAHAFSSGPQRCFIGFGHAQWPKWIGCAMAAHENLAGGLIGFAGALFAATLAWFAVQRQIKAQDQAEVRERELRTTDLARILYAELAYLVARCCFDSEKPWKAYWQGGARPGEMDVVRLRKFTPVVPVVYLASAGQLALLRGNAPQALIEFQYRLSALRREIENIANDADSSTKPIAVGAVKLVGLRFRQTLEPALKAMESLAPMVHDSEEIEAIARALYYESRKDEDPNKTLKQRINELTLSP